MTHNSLPKGGNRFTAWIGCSVIKLVGWKIEGELPPLSKCVIAVAPHTSNWDFFLGVAVLFALKIKIKFLGKHSIFVPVVKHILTWLGGIPVDRRSPHGIVGQVVEQFNQHDKFILAVAPEGTRSAIYPWKTGFLAIAAKAEVPVLLIGFDFEKKIVVIGPCLQVEKNFDDTMREVYAFYRTIQPKYPAKSIYK